MSRVKEERAGEVTLMLPPPSILCSNHTNSLTDALLLVTTVPRNVTRAPEESTREGADLLVISRNVSCCASRQRTRSLGGERLRAG